jgi:hypothetical protein
VEMEEMEEASFFVWIRSSIPYLSSHIRNTYALNEENTVEEKINTGKMANILLFVSLQERSYMMKIPIGFLLTSERPLLKLLLLKGVEAVKGMRILFLLLTKRLALLSLVFLERNAPYGSNSAF